MASNSHHASFSSHPSEMLVCPQCGSSHFAEVRGLHGCGQHMLFLFLCLCLLVPGIVYFLTHMQPSLVCRECRYQIRPHRVTSDS
jgi:ribosomal protein L32